MMETPNPFVALLKSRKFWLALLGVVQTIIFQFIPSFPQEVWIAIDALLVSVIIGITVEDAAEKGATTIINESPAFMTEPEEPVQG